jgi:hypothetical protein
MMVQRWGILQMAMPRGLSIGRIIALVNALAKLHNFCIEEVEGGKLILQQLDIDTNNIMNNEDGFVPMETNNNNDDILLPRVLMDAVHHFCDLPRNVRRQRERIEKECNLPRQQLLTQVINSHLARPNIK